MENYDEYNIVNAKEEADINYKRRDEDKLFDRLSRLQKLVKKESFLRQLGNS
jgi:hypothetical protein